MSDIADGNNIQKTDQIKGSAGHLFFNTTKLETGYGPDIVEDHSFVQLAHNDHAQISLQAGGKIRTDAMSDMSINVHRNMFENILGDSKVSIGRDQSVTIDGALNITVGKYGTEEKNAEQKLMKLAKEIQSQSIATAKSTTNNRIPCPLCKSKVATQPSALKAEIQAARTVRIMEDTGLGSRFKGIANKLLKLLQSIPKIFGIQSTSSFYTKTKSCGSPGCVNHTVEDLNASLTAYNKTATSLIDQNKSLIEELQQKLGKGTGGLTLVTKGACVISTGLYKNEVDTHFNKGHHTLQANGLVVDPDGKGRGAVLGSKGSPARMVQVGTPKFTESDMFLNASGKFTVNAGADGISLQTNGPLHVHGSSVEIRARDGEAHFSSGNVTVVSGATVKIQADMKTGEKGIILESKSVHTTGKFSAQGDIIVRGGAHFDGAVSMPFLQIPSCDQDVRESKPPQMVTGPASWMPKNTVLNVLQEVNDSLTSLAADPFYLCTPTYLQEYIKKWYGEFMGAIPLEMCITGWAIALSFGVNGGGPMVSSGVWGGFIPLLNYPHNHEKYNEYHGGSVTMPLFSPYDLSEGRSAAGVHGSHIPMPPPINTPIGLRPGKISQPGPCGGGGNFIKNRNLNYGTDVLDPFNGSNYVDRGTNNGLNMYTNSPEFTNYKYGVLPSLSGINTNTNNTIDCT